MPLQLRARVSAWEPGCTWQLPIARAASATASAVSMTALPTSAMRATRLTIFLFIKPD